MNNNLNSLIYVILGFGIVGLLFLISSIIMLLISKKKMLHCTAKTNGKVTNIIENINHDSDAMIGNTYSPVFEYEVNGTIFNKESVYGYIKCPYEIGQEVVVYYNSNKPSEFYVDGYSAPQKVRMIFCILRNMFFNYFHSSLYNNSLI